MGYLLNINPEQCAEYITKDLMQRIAVSKKTSVNGQPPPGNNPVNSAWLVFDPQSENGIPWEEHYTVYASTTTIEDGQPILQSSPWPGNVALGYYYDFNGTAFTQTPGAPQDGYYVRNHSSRLFYFGLAQAPQNDPGNYSPLCITPLGGQENACFAPEETVYVYLTGYTQQGTVTVNAWSNPCPATLVDGTPLTLCFSKANSQFYPIDKGKCPEGCS